MLSYYLRARLLDFTVQINFCCTYCRDLIYSDLMKSPSTKLHIRYEERDPICAAELVKTTPTLWTLEAGASAFRCPEVSAVPRALPSTVRPPGPRPGASGAAEPSSALIYTTSAHPTVHGVSTEVTESISPAASALPRCALVPALLHQDWCP